MTLVILESLKLEHKLVAVYQVPTYDYDVGAPKWEKNAASVDRFGPRRLEELGSIPKTYLTVDTFEETNDDCENMSITRFLQCSLGVLLEHDIVWIAPPAKETLIGLYKIGVDEPAVGYSYVSPAIIVTIPSAGEGARCFE